MILVKPWSILMINQYRPLSGQAGFLNSIPVTVPSISKGGGKPVSVHPSASLVQMSELIPDSFMNCHP
jgi:hypothetical protein